MAECRARRWDGSSSFEVPVLGQRSELVAQLVETVALLTQHTTIHGRIELHGLAQGHKKSRTAPRRLPRPRPQRGHGSRFAAERRGIDQGIARTARLRLRLGRGRCRRGRLRFSSIGSTSCGLSRRASSRLRASMLDSVIPPRWARISMTMRPLALYVEGESRR